MKRQSTYIRHIIMAVAISIICNFSYLLMLVSNQSDAGNHRTNPEAVIVSGRLSISDDHLYGYIYTESGERIYVGHRKLDRLNLADGDELKVEAAKTKSEPGNLYMHRVLERNGKEFKYSELYRGSGPWFILLYLLFFFFTLSFILLVIMNVKGRYATWRQLLPRAFVCLIITFAAYFISPIPHALSGEIIPAYQSHQIVNTVVALKLCFMFTMVILYSRIYTLINREQRMLLENEMLRNENLITQYNMLTSQVNPHFLFNSLSSLSMLVREKDEERALNYIDQLAYTFRYLSQNGTNTSFVKLSDEMHFAEAYCYLYKIRYAEKISFDFNIEERYLDYELPPISLQPLIGNTVKHNTISSKQLFSVRIYTENGFLVVANEKRPMLEPNPGTGVGLSNLNSRYQLLLNRDIEIVDNDKEFVVRLPLKEPNA